MTSKSATEHGPPDRTPDEVALRDVAESDLPLFFAHQLDPDATRMAAFPARDRAAFMAHWHKILADNTTIVRSILHNGQVAGNIGSWEQEGRREVGYWLGKQYWGKRIASRALALFLAQVEARPLYAHVATHNLASRRVLEKCGFRVRNHEAGRPDEPDALAEELLLELR